MKTSNLIILVGSITVGFLFFGQGCLPEKDSGSKATGQGNGDYYGGMQNADFQKITSAIEGASQALGKVDSKQFNLSDPQSGEGETVPADANCQWAHLRECNDGKQGAIFNACPTENPDITYYGFQALAFTDQTCSNNDPGDTFLHSFLILFVNTKTGATSAVSTLKHKDYREVEMGGGESFTLLADGFAYNLLGRRITYNGLLVKIDISQRTPQPIVFSEDPQTKDRFVSGYFETNHNIAEFSSHIGFENVKWEPTNCCYPTSGTASVEFTGKVIGKGLAKFTGCGKADITINTETRSVDFSPCPGI